MNFLRTKPIDISEIVAIEVNLENSKFITPNTTEEHLRLLKDDDIMHLVIKSESSDILGFIILAGLTNNHKSIEFRRIVIRDKGKGLGRKAVRYIKTYAFETLQCNRLWLDVLKKNTRAKSLYLSEGFKEEGVLREALLTQEGFQDLVLMSILKKDFNND